MCETEGAGGRWVAGRCARKTCGFLAVAPGRPIASRIHKKTGPKINFSLPDLLRLSCRRHGQGLSSPLIGASKIRVGHISIARRYSYWPCSRARTPADRHVAMPRSTASRRVISSSAAASRQPITGPALCRGRNCGREIITCERWRSPVLWVGLNRHPHQWQVQDRAGERQHDQRRQVGEVIGLDHQRRPRLAGVTLQGDGDEIAALRRSVRLIPCLAGQRFPKCHFLATGLACFPFGQQPSLPGGFGGVAGCGGVRHPNLHRPQAHGTQLVAAALDAGDGGTLCGHGATCSLASRRG